MLEVGVLKRGLWLTSDHIRLGEGILEKMKQELRAILIEEQDLKRYKGMREGH